MKSVQFTGGVLFLSGILLFGLMHLAMAIYLPSLHGVAGDPISVFGLVGHVRGWVPYILSIVLILAGLFFLFSSRSRKEH